MVPWPDQPKATRCRTSDRPPVCPVNTSQLDNFTLYLVARFSSTPRHRARPAESAAWPWEDAVVPAVRPLLLLHSAYGLRAAIGDAHARLAAAGFVVETPDLYGGRTADRLQDALALRDRLLGHGQVLADLQQRARALRDRCGGAPLTVVGFSYGASRALDLALADPQIEAVVLFHGTGQVPAAGRLSVRVLGHFGTEDPFEPPEAVAAFTRRLRAAGAAVTVHAYPGAGHLFTDPGLEEFDAAAAELAWQRTLAWLRA
jgi:dienelactone hydrolase